MDTNLLLGSVFVAVNAYTRFSMPPSIKSSTTRFRFYFAMNGYIFVLLAVYGILASFPELILVILKLKTSSNTGDQFQEIRTSIGNPLAIALFLTILLPTVPLLKNLDDKLRLKFHDIADIPHHIRHLRRQLDRATWSITEPVRQAVSKVEKTSGIELQDIRFSTSVLSTPQELYTKVNSMFFLIEELCLNKQNYDRFFNSFIKPEDPISEQAPGKSWLEAIKATKPGAIQAAALFTHWRNFPSDEMQTITQAFEDRCRETLNRLYELIARAVLACEASHSRRAKILKEHFGFLVLQERPVLSMNHSLLIAIIVAVLMCALYPLLPAREMRNPHGHLKPSWSQIIAMASILTSLAVVIGIYPKSCLDWARRDPEPGSIPPIQFYVFAGILAFLAGLFVIFIVRFNFGYVDGTFDSMGAFNIAQKGVQNGWPWILIFGVAPAMGVAFICDVRWKVKGPLLHVLRGGILAGIMILTLWIAFLRMHRDLELHMIILLFVIGFTLGILVPSWNERIMQNDREEGLGEP